MSYDHTQIWRHALAERADDPYATQRERLRVAYAEFWTNAVTLARQIGKDVPELTLHDEAHFQALWERADQVLGNASELNPLEVFIFGSAILLHDAANCIAAYSGGLKEIEASPEWKDEVVEQLSDGEIEINDKSIENPPADIRKRALLNALRRLHGARAEYLPALKFKNSTSQEYLYLFPNESLRKHLGRIIGLVSASHHWDIQDLPKRLQKTLGAIAGFPHEWSIRPIRIACLLRCTDALQLDQSRTPDFLYALLQLSGLSESHWRAQNRLSAPAPDPDDSSALIFTSTSNFSDQDAEAWWIAYEAIKVADRELQHSNSLLKDLRQPTFQITRIRDAESPSRLSQHVTTKGWRPVAAEIVIRNVDNVIQMFGGEQLYGRDLLVPLREILQNSADAVRFRRTLSGGSYTGEINVRLKAMSDDPDTYLLEIEDDGIGMSEAVLTGPLLDFGTSYFGSELAKVERPGLRSRQPKRTGRYGIGFFSVFMISNEVDVVSRPFEEGLAHARTLRFSKGMSLRPLLLDRYPNSYSVGVSTRVVAKLSLATKDEILGSIAKHKDQSVSLSQVVGFLCPTLDVDVFVEQDSAPRRLVHQKDWWENREAWLKRITAADLKEDAEYNDYLSRCSNLLEFIDSDDRSLGLACIPWSHKGAVNDTVGGFSDLSRRMGYSLHSGNYVGSLDHEPSGPKRDVGDLRAKAKMGDWASTQAHKLSQLKASPYCMHIASLAVARWRGDVRSIAAVLLNRQMVMLTEICERLADGETMFAALGRSPFAHGREQFIGKLKIPQLSWHRDDDLEVREGLIEGDEDEPYYRANVRRSKSTFLGAMHSLTKEYGQLVIEDIFDEPLARYVGLSSARDRLYTGQEIVNPALRISLVKHK